MLLNESRVSVVGIATGYGLDDRGVGVPSPGRVKKFLFSTSSRTTLSPGIKRPGREADHSPLTSAEVKKRWVYTPPPTYSFMA
jgi:hypothetical protein